MRGDENEVPSQHEVDQPKDGDRNLHGDVGCQEDTNVHGVHESTAATMKRNRKGALKKMRPCVDGSCAVAMKLHGQCDVQSKDLDTLTRSEVESNMGGPMGDPSPCWLGPQCVAKTGRGQSACTKRAELWTDANGTWQC